MIKLLRYTKFNDWHLFWYARHFVCLPVHLSDQPCPALALNPSPHCSSPLPVLPSAHYYSVQHGSTQTDYANVQQGPLIAEGSKGSSLGQPEVGPDALCRWHLKPGGGDLLELLSTAVICLCWAQILLSAMCGTSCFSGKNLSPQPLSKKRERKNKVPRKKCMNRVDVFQLPTSCTNVLSQKSHFHSQKFYIFLWILRQSWKQLLSQAESASLSVSKQAPN